MWEWNKKRFHFLVLWAKKSNGKDRICGKSFVNTVKDFGIAFTPGSRRRIMYILSGTENIPGCVVFVLDYWQYLKPEEKVWDIFFWSHTEREWTGWTWLPGIKVAFPGGCMRWTRLKEINDKNSGSEINLLSTDEHIIFSINIKNRWAVIGNG